MNMHEQALPEPAPFTIVALTPAGFPDPRLVIAADRAGCLGILNGEIGPLPRAAVEQLAGRTRTPYGVKLPDIDSEAMELLETHAAKGLGWLVLDAPAVLARPELLSRLAALHIRVILEVTEWDDRLVDLTGHYGIQVKGHEAGGLVGEETSFVLLQKALHRQAAAVFVRGGVGLHSTAAVRCIGAAGVVLDDQLLLLKESPLPAASQASLRDFTGHETGLVTIADKRWRVYEKPGFQHLRRLKKTLAGTEATSAEQLLVDAFGWSDPASQIVPVGQAAAFAASFADRYSTFGRLAQALLAESERRLADTVALDPLGEGQGVAASHGTAYPIVQGPMTRVSDVAAFAQETAGAGALPMIALALMPPEQVEVVVRETAERLAGRPWGIGLLGFAPADLLAAQVEVALRHAPQLALIAGGRPEQAKDLEAAGITSCLHVPSTRLLTMFLERGAKRFVLEGRECGGHVGPLSSLVLWDSMVSTLLEHAGEPAQNAEIHVLFAGGIHDARSAALVAALAAPLVERGFRIGVLMGTAYLFTREIVDTAAIVPQFQKEAISCTSTVTLETAPGHASRAAATPFARYFHEQRLALEAQNASGDAIRDELEGLSLGRLRIASKGQERNGDGRALHKVPVARQKRDGMYMIGQVATLRDSVITIADLHRAVSVDSQALLAATLEAQRAQAKPALQTGRPADVAVVGLAGIFPGANSVSELWDNILGKVNAITEVPKHRWDWRIYFDEDRSAPDRIYSRWGGFLDDLLFDPFAYGIPPRALKAIDPLQLMTLEVLHRCLVDAGLENAPESREKMSVILGASGGAGDVGAQYAVRSELPRFLGDLPADAADRLPDWTEDSFAGILLNVAAGRSANRFDLGGVNYTIDAACASSLAAVYQAVLELESGRSDVVIAGGIDTVQGPFGYLCFSKTQALSPRGRCRTFDAGADGIVISEGIAAVALKRLADAERDGDDIYAVIKGIGGSSDGRAKSMTAPHPDGQIRALRRAYEMAGYSPATVGLFEAHGTGTVAGDTAELETVSRLLAEADASPHDHAIGSVKSLIGHTKATAGITGLIKAVQACRHKVLPPHGDVETPNRKFVEPDTPLYMVDQPEPWLASADRPRRAAVSAFGFGGTNFHVTLEEYRDAIGSQAEPAPRERWPVELLVWRGADRQAVAAAVRRTADLLAQADAPQWRDVAATLWHQAPNEGRTATLVVRCDGDAAQQVMALASHLEDPSQPLPPAASFSETPQVAAGGKVAMIFPGQGTQYVGMLRDLALFAEVRTVLETADDTLVERMREKDLEAGRLSRAIFAHDIVDQDSRKRAAERLTRTDVAQPALGAIEAGVFKLLERFGLRIDMAAGHSYGEFVALHAAGVLTLDQLIVVSEARGRFMREAAIGGELGTMAAAHADRQAVAAAIKDLAEVWIANHNAPDQTVLSGSRAGIEAAMAALDQAGLACQPIAVGAAFHSPIVAPAAERLSELISALDLRVPAFPVYSNRTAGAYPDDPAGIRGLLADHLENPVEFVSEIEAMYAQGARVFVSAGPKAAHAGMIRQILDGRPHRALAIDDGEGGLSGLLQSLGALLAEGAQLDIARLWAGRDCRILDAQLDGGARRPVISKHMWWLNGSGAWSVESTPPQVLTLEDVSARQKDRSPVEHEHAQVAVRQQPYEVNAGSVDPIHKTEQERYKMAEYDHNGEASSPLEAFHTTMRRFLEVEESVMLAYLNGAGRSRSARQVLQPYRNIAPPGLTADPPGEPAPKPQHVNGSNGAGPRPDVANGGHRPGAEPAAASGKGNGADQHHHPEASSASSSHCAAPEVQSQEAPSATPAAANGNGATRAGLADTLLELVENRTGYPRDMLGMNQNLEADLGIDSIKRVEIVGALLKTLPADASPAVADLGEALNGQKTLNGIIDCLWQRIGNNGEGHPRPFDQTGAETPAVQACARPPRFLIEAHAEELPKLAPVLKPGIYLITDDGTGIAAALLPMIESAGGTVKIVNVDVAAEVEEVLGADPNHQPIGFIHLAPIGSRRLSLAADPAEWLSQLRRNELLAHQLIRRFASSLSTGGRVVLASGLGGTFGRSIRSAPGVFVQGGGPGLAKCLREEWPDVMAKAVDLQLDQSAEANARRVFEELAADGGRIEVGYPDGQRTIFKTVAADLAQVSSMREALPEGAVVLATGGARGITAEVLRPMAKPGVTLVLVGRSPIPEQEDEALAGIDSATALRTRLIELARAAGEAPKPSDIESRVQATLREREMRANIADLQAAGAKVVYRVADLCNPAEAAELISGIYADVGRVDGVIHGAGVIEDRLVSDKEPESWLKVVETKALSAFALARALRPEQLRFFVTFGSVAGRYGNSGQADYAVANELLNRMAWQLRALWPQHIKIAVLNWGPWLGTQHGVGMVSPETRRKFEARGVRLIEPSAGATSCLEEISRGPIEEVEIVIGEGPWEEQEALRGRFAEVQAAVHEPIPVLPLVAGAKVGPGPRGGRIVSRVVSLDRDLYLDHHRLNGVPVLPAAVSVEFAAEAAAMVWPQWQVTGIEELRLLKGFRLEDDLPQHLEMLVVGSEHGDASGFRASVELRASGEASQAYYRATVCLADALPQTYRPTQVLEPRPAQITAADAYREILFHGPLLQTVRRLIGMDESGVCAEVSGSTPAMLVGGAAPAGAWLFDPALMDAAAQLALVWSYQHRGAVALPNRFGHLRRFSGGGLPARMVLRMQRDAQHANDVHAEVLVLDEAGRVVVTIDELESTASPSLNRFRGWRGEIRV